MAKNNLIFVVLGIVILLAFGGMIQKNYNLFAVSGSSMTRSAPTSVSPGSSFQISYSTTATGTWGASIVDSISGGCKFPSGSNEYKSVMLSEDGSTKTLQITAPSSGSCTFHGDYKFGTDAIINFPDLTVTIGGTTECAWVGESCTTTSDCCSQLTCQNLKCYVPDNTCTSGQTKCEGTTYYTCSNNAWVSQGLVNGKCGYGTTCTADSSCTLNTCTTTTCSDSCGNSYTGTKDCTPSIDINMVLFKIGNFSVTLLMLVGGFFALLLILKLIG